MAATPLAANLLERPLVRARELVIITPPFSPSPIWSA